MRRRRSRRFVTSPPSRANSPKSCKTATPATTSTGAGPDTGLLIRSGWRRPPVFRGGPMRKALAVLLGLVVLGALAFLVLTEPVVYRLVRGKSVLPTDHVVNLENGRVLFLAGGCSQCHAKPGQDD